MDMSKFTSLQPEENEDEDVSDDILVPYDPMGQLVQFGHYNNFNSEFISHVKEFEKNDNESNNPKLNLVEYDYYTPVKMIAKQSNRYQYVYRENLTSIMNGSTGSVVYPMLNNMDYVLNQYELIYGHLPTKVAGDDYTKEMLLVVGAGNKVSKDVLKTIGIEF
jgi:hypothetical protein